MELVLVGVVLLELALCSMAIILPARAAYRHLGPKRCAQWSVAALAIGQGLVWSGLVFRSESAVVVKVINGCGLLLVGMDYAAIQHALARRNWPAIFSNRWVVIAIAWSIAAPVQRFILIYGAGYCAMALAGRM